MYMYTHIYIYMSVYIYIYILVLSNQCLHLVGSYLFASFGSGNQALVPKTGYLDMSSNIFKTSTGDTLKEIINNINEQAAYLKK